MASKRATVAAVSKHFSKLFNPRASSSLLPPSSAATRFFCGNAIPPTSSEDDSDDNNFPVMVKCPPQKFKMKNPFQLGGPGNLVEVDEVKEGALVRVTLPGVGPDGIRVWSENNTVFFAGKGEIEYDGEDSGRRYGGSLEFQPELHTADRVKSEMKNGILRLIVPNAAEGEQKRKTK
ncbi:hypothetical protein NMG60_11029706 [Bertholletia excelsa]